MQGRPVAAENPLAMTKRALAVPLLFASSLAAGCISDQTSPGCLFATDPPGARVVVDGGDTGFATPCNLELDMTEPHTVEFHLPGYAVAKRELEPSETWEVVPWSDGDIGLNTWRFPLFLTFVGLLFPLRFDDDLAPSRVYVPLEVETQD